MNIANVIETLRNVIKTHGDEAYLVNAYLMPVWLKTTKPNNAVRVALRHQQLTMFPIPVIKAKDALEYIENVLIRFSADLLWNMTPETILPSITLLRDQRIITPETRVVRSAISCTLSSTDKKDLYTDTTEMSEVDICNLVFGDKESFEIFYNEAHLTPQLSLVVMPISCPSLLHNSGIEMLVPRIFYSHLTSKEQQLYLQELTVLYNQMANLL